MSLGAYLTGAILCLAWMGWLAWKKELLTLVMVAPVFAYFAARSFLAWGFGISGRLGSRASSRWNGFYYEYGVTHLRAVEQEEFLIFLEADILQAIGQKKSQATQFFTEEERVPFDDKGAMGLTRAGCRRLLAKSTHPEAKGLLAYLENDAFRPFDKRRARETGEE